MYYKDIRPVAESIKRLYRKSQAYSIDWEANTYYLSTL